MEGIIVPGEKVLDSPREADGCFHDDKATFASVISIVRDDRLIPLKGPYVPLAGDYVVGVVSVEKFSGYVVDLHSPYEGTFSTRDVREEFKVGDVISAKIVETNEVNEAVLAEPRKFSGGNVLEVSFVKVPRIIGRNGSMLQMIRDYTGTELFVGKNGRIYLRGGNIPIAARAVLTIDKEAHLRGLTDRMKAFLESAKNGG